MSKHYGAIAFTEAVRDVQRDHGSHVFYDRKRIQGTATPGTDALTEDERDYLAGRDGFYLATVSETGWPYVQFRGGPAGFLRVIDDHTIGWAEPHDSPPPNSNRTSLHCSTNSPRCAPRTPNCATSSDAGSNPLVGNLNPLDRPPAQRRPRWRRLYR